MKKLIAIAVVFVLVAGAAFAADFSGAVIGTVNVLEGNSGKDDAGDANPVTTSAEMNRIRIDGGGEVADGKFGGYFRADVPSLSIDKPGEDFDFDDIGDLFSVSSFSGNAWWKPIDQLKILIGSNGGDGFYGKEGVTGWMFQQTVYDTGVAVGAGNIWGGGYSEWPYVYRAAFFGGDGGGNALRLDITPLDMLAINLSLPVFNAGETGDVFAKLMAQVDLKFDFGNIALTYNGGLGYDKDKGRDDPGQIFVYYGGSFGALSLDFGVGYKFANHYMADEGDKKAGDEKANPINIGLGLKFSADAFGVKFRAMAGMGGADKSTGILAEVLPYFNIADNLTAFVSAGLAIYAPDGDDAVTGWHFNPYIQVGEEWGAKFLAGVKLWSNGKGDEPVTNWAIPIALIVSF